MKKTKKIVALFLAAVMLVCTTVAATVAFLYSKTEVVENTFTVGDVKIILNEQDADGSETNLVVYDNSENRDEANAYHLLPNTTHTKDPAVSVKQGSEESYIRAIATVKYRAAADDILNPVSNWLDLNANWIAGEPVTTRATNNEGVEWITRVYEFRYKETVNANVKDAEGNFVTPDGLTLVSVTKGDVTEAYYKMPALFTTITVSGNLTNDQVATLHGMEINVEAHAIQAEGFADANAAWAAFTY